MSLQQKWPYCSEGEPIIMCVYYVYVLYVIEAASERIGPLVGAARQRSALLATAVHKKKFNEKNVLDTTGKEKTNSIAFSSSPPVKLAPVLFQGNGVDEKKKKTKS